MKEILLIKGGGGRHVGTSDHFTLLCQHKSTDHRIYLHMNLDGGLLK